VLLLLLQLGKNLVLPVTFQQAFALWTSDTVDATLVVDSCKMILLNMYICTYVRVKSFV
jgi:hypothetical protein